MLNFSEKKLHKIGRIDQIVRDYFADRPEEKEVSAKSLMPLLIEKELFEKDHRAGLDRIDLQVEVESVPLGDLMQSGEKSESSAVIRARVVKARAIQSERFKDIPGVFCNARMPEQDLEKHCLLDIAARRFLFARLNMLQVSARSYTRILKVGRTIADLPGSGKMEMKHLAEAVGFRGLDRMDIGKKKEMGVVRRLQE